MALPTVWRCHVEISNQCLPLVGCQRSLLASGNLREKKFRSPKSYDLKMRYLKALIPKVEFLVNQKNSKNLREETRTRLERAVVRSVRNGETTV